MKKYKVLIVDDEKIIREGLQKHIDWETLNLEVIGLASSAEEAFEIFTTNIPDILITDIRMRGRDGLELVEALLGKGYTPYTIVISGYDDFNYARRAIQLSLVKEYILKPVDTDYLSNLLQKLVGQLNSTSKSQENILLSEYSDFIKLLKSNGYNRFKTIQALKTQDKEYVNETMDIISVAINNEQVSLSIAKCFCSNFILTLISEGILNDEVLHGRDLVEILEEFNTKDSLNHYIRETIHEKVFNKLSVAPNCQSRLIDVALEIIEKEYCSSKFNLSILADQLEISPNYLSSLFIANVGVGFMKYRLEKQMEKAKMLLSDPVYKIYQIADATGFNDEKNFSKQFKKYTGMSPKEFRNKYIS